MPGDVTGSLVYDARTARVRVPAGPGVHQPAARRRDQPHAAEDPGRAAGGDGGAAGLGRRRRRARCPTRSWCARPRTRSSTRAPTRCPRRSSTGSWSSSPSARPAARRRSPCCSGTPPASTRATWPRPAYDRSRRAADLAAGREAVRQVQVAPEVLGYVVDLCRATRQSAVAAAGRLAARRDRAAGVRARVGLAVRPRVRDPGRREGAGPAGPAAPGAAAPGGRAGGRHRRRRAGRRARHRPRPALSRPGWDGRLGSARPARRCSRRCSSA